MAQERQANCRKLSLDFPFEFRFHIEGKHLGVEVFELRHIFEHWFLHFPFFIDFLDLLLLPDYHFFMIGHYLFVFERWRTCKTAIFRVFCCAATVCLLFPTFRLAILLLFQAIPSRFILVFLHVIQITGILIILFWLLAVIPQNLSIYGFTDIGIVTHHV